MELWVAVMHFGGSTAFWLQSMDPTIEQITWREFCLAVCARFEHDHHNHLIRQFFHIKQTTIVTEYVELFDTLMHQILAHDPTFSMTTIVNRFVDGLRADIKAIVFIQRPLDLDNVVSLVILQDELVFPRPQPTSVRSKEQSSSQAHSRLHPAHSSIF